MKQQKPKSLKKNFLFNLIYHLVLTIIPIITTPYVSRVLLTQGVGQYSLAFSITSYFVVFANFGFVHYAQKEIAKYQDDREKQTKLFYEILILKFIITLISTIAYIGFIQFNFDENVIRIKYILYLLSPLIISVGIDTSFLLTGNENFKVLAIVSTLVKIANVVLIFIFVKNIDDLWKYSLINSSSSFVTAFIFLLLIRKYLVKVKLKELNIKKHFIPSLKLFIPTIALTIYSVIDKTMLGFMIKGEQEVITSQGVVLSRISDIELGNYEQADKIIKLINTGFYSFGLVLIPRNSYYYKKGMINEFKANIYKSLKFCYLLALPALFGIISIADNFCPWFFGEGYEKVPLLLITFSPFFIFAGMNFIFGNQYLIIINKDNVYTKSLFIGAITNVVLNLLLIKPYMAVGSAIASVAAEFIILVYQLIYLKKEFPLSKVIEPIIKYLDASLIMFFVTFTISKYLAPSLVNTLIIGVSGATIYFGLLLLFREDYTLQVFRRITSKIRKH